jgi:hypothetical protein
LFDAQDVLYVPGLKKIFLPVSTMEERGFVVNFHRGKVLIHLNKSSSDVAVVVGVSEGVLYKLHEKPD